LRGDGKPSVSVQDGINSMRVIDAAIASSQEKKVIKY